MSPDTTTDKTSGISQKVEESLLPIDVAAIAKNPEDVGITKEETATREIVANIPLGIKGGGKTLITCEKGIKAFVKDVLAKDGNHLPNSELGVWVYYLTEGVKRDFGRTWESAPTCLKPKETKTEKAAKEKKRIITKAEKNELLAKLDMAYYQSDISCGNLTLEQAFSLIKEAYQKKEELEGLGYYLSPNKTEGVKPFNWEKIVNDSVGSMDATFIYQDNKIDLILPNLIKEFYQNDRKQKRGIIKDIMASALYGTAYEKAWFSGVKDYGYYDEDHPEAGGAETFKVNSMDDLLAYFKQDRASDVKKMVDTYNINSVHLAKQNIPGMKKDRWVCWDLTSKKEGRRELHLWSKTGMSRLVEDESKRRVMQQKKPSF